MFLERLRKSCWLGISYSTSTDSPHTPSSAPLCSVGRAYRNDEGETMVAPPIARSDWARLQTIGPKSNHWKLRNDAELADWWLGQAAAEHASVAAFSRLSLQLLALSAPPNLLDQVHQAARDEVRHARAFWSFAAAYGCEQGPGPLPLTTIEAPDLAKIAIETLRDGCIGEGASAAILAECAHVAEDSEIRSWLEEISDDEREHCRLAWSILRWLVESGAPEVELVLNEALLELEALPCIDAPRATVERMPDQRQLAIRSTVIQAIVLPGLRTLLGAA